MSSGVFWESWAAAGRLTPPKQQEGGGFALREPIRPRLTGGRGSPGSGTRTNRRSDPCRAWPGMAGWNTAAPASGAADRPTPKDRRRRGHAGIAGHGFAADLALHFGELVKHLLAALAERGGERGVEAGQVAGQACRRPAPRPSWFAPGYRPEREESGARRSGRARHRRHACNRPATTVARHQLAAALSSSVKPARCNGAGMRPRMAR
jgi:hypothetical protein